MENKYKQFIANERGEDINDMDITTEEISGRSFQFIMTPSHGFLIVPASSLYYNLAKKIQADGYGYNIPNVAVFLEEDCQATEFASKLPKGQTIKATDLARSMGITVMQF